ncbi:unnamed protein product [Euphydryas editha]|uniref:Uncharacterized protein n=1 Tax=Euphydryas editha TaxID=104508 RepID=A0AAU9TM99_EUPED|nr:unnamed protein product [Euphydryas editha]
MIGKIICQSAVEQRGRSRSNPSPIWRRGLCPAVAQQWDVHRPTRPPAAAARARIIYSHSLTLSLGVGGVPRGELVDDGAHAARVERRQRRLVDARRRALRRPQHAHVLYTLTLSLSHLGLAAFLAASSSMTARTRRASSGGSGGWWMRADAPSGGRSTRTYYILSLSHSLTWGWRRSSRRARR